MKKIILIFVLLTVIKTVYSKHFYNSSFTLNVPYKDFFEVKFDHVIYQGSNRKINLENIRPGQHYVEVIKFRNKNSGPGRIPIVITHRWITIPSNSGLMALIDENRQICVSQVVLNYFTNNPDHGCANSCKDCEFLSGYEFKQLKLTMMSASFESCKINIARQAFSHHKILSRQVEEMMKELWFDLSRLELAKFAYDYTYDQENYYIVNNSFEFDSSIKELDYYINHS